MTRLGYSDHLSDIYYSPLKYRRLVVRIADQLGPLKKKLKFNAIAFRGSSGAALAYPLSILLNIPIICIRKPERSHGLLVESSKRNIRRYIIIDDFIDGGGTMNAILESMSHKYCWIDEQEATPMCVGIVLWDSGEQHRAKIFDKHHKTHIPIFYWGT